MDYMHFDILNFECRRTNNWDSQFTGLVPQNKLGLGILEMLGKDLHNHVKYTNTWNGYCNSAKLKNSKFKPIIQPDSSPKKSGPSWNYVHKMYQNLINKMKSKISHESQ